MRIVRDSDENEKGFWVRVGDADTSLMPGEAVVARVLSVEYNKPAEVTLQRKCLMSVHVGCIMFASLILHCSALCVESDLEERICGNLRTQPMILHLSHILKSSEQRTLPPLYHRQLLDRDINILRFRNTNRGRGVLQTIQEDWSRNSWFLFLFLFLRQMR